MAQNYATEYSKNVAERFKIGSFTESMVSNDYKFVGNKTVQVYSVNTVAMNDYNRTGSSPSASRYGTISNLGNTLQEMTMQKDRSFTFAIDRGDLEESQQVMEAGKALRRQLDEVTTPEIDKYRFQKWIEGSGTLKQLATAPSSTTILASILELGGDMTNAGVPAEGRTLILPVSQYIKLKEQIIDSYRGAGDAALSRGTVGQLDNMTVKMVPDSYLTSGVYFMIKYNGSTVDPMKLNDYHTHDNPMGVSGFVVEGRFIYDSFVIGAKGAGIGVCGSSDAVLNAPVMSIASHAVTITPVSGVEFYYTVDGTDPHYSSTAQKYTSAVTLTSGQTLKACGRKAGCASITGEKAYE